MKLVLVYSCLLVACTEAGPPTVTDGNPSEAPPEAPASRRRERATAQTPTEGDDRDRGAPDGSSPPETGRPRDASTDDGSGGKGEQQPSAGMSPAAEPTPGPLLPVGSGAGVIINEVRCRDGEFVELINRGAGGADLRRFAIADRIEPGAEVPLDGTLGPGARVSVAFGGLACDDEVAVLFEDGVVIDEVRPPLMPATASFGRLPDGEGPFALATPTPDEPNRAFVDEAARVFLALDEAVPRTLPELHISMSQDAVESLRGVTTDSPRPWLAATLTFHDARGEVGPISTGIHLKGRSVFRDIDGKAAFRLDFGRFEEGNSLFGVEHLTLNNFVQDPSASHERVYYGLLARQGRPAPRVGYVNVWVNDEPFGVYLALESNNEQSFLGRCFSSTDLLYEGTYGMDLYTTYVDDFDEDYGSDPGRGTLVRMIDVLADVNEASLIEDTEALIAWDEVVPQMAADLFAGHYDSYTVNRNNFTFHFDDRGRLSLISSGPDQAFEQVAERSPDGSRLMGHCLESAACTQALDDALEDIAADTRAFLSEGGADRLRDDAARLTDAFEADPRIEWNYPDVERFVDEMVTFIERSARTQ